MGIERVCPQSECQISTSGKCLEGFELADRCPYQQVGVTGTSEEGTDDRQSQDFVDLPSGEALSISQANEVARSGPTKVIVIAGPYGSGKTTVLTSLFEAFQEAPFGNYTFKGSRTLVGFEQRCHLGRKESGRLAADTPHTSAREGVSFLHLNLAFRDKSGADSCNLLLSDISGELFKRVRDGSDAASSLSAIRRADHLCIVVDGEKLCSNDVRHIARNDSRSILRSLTESGQLWPECVIEIVITKWDAVVQRMQDADGELVKSYIEDTISALRSTISRWEHSVYEVAARPPTNARVPFAHGLPTLLRAWMHDEQEQSPAAQYYLSETSTREIARYTESVLAKNKPQGHYVISRI